MIGYIIGAVVGGLLITFLIRRFWLWALKRIQDEKLRVFIAAALTLALSSVIGGLGYADGGPPRFLYAAMIYVVPTIMWLVVDLFAIKGRGK